jgi:hypothetical protein
MSTILSARTIGSGVLLLAWLTSACHSALRRIDRPFQSALSSQRALPPSGTVRGELPPGDGMMIVRTRCLLCHEASLINQQRLTRSQWEAELTKMQSWGSPIRDDEKSQALAYLVAHAGPDNTRFEPTPVAAIAP